MNAISYKVYKKCPRLNKYLFKTFKCSFTKCEIPIQWQSAKEDYIPNIIYSKSFADSSPSVKSTVSILLFLAGMNIIVEYSLQTNVSHFISNRVPLSL